MKTKQFIILFSLLIINFVGYSQSSTNINQEFIEANRNFILKSMPLFVQDGDKYHFKYYFKNDKFYFTCEYNIDLELNEIESAVAKDWLINFSKENVYKIATFMSYAKGGFLKNFDKMYNSKFINFEIIYLTTDYKSKKMLFYISAEAFYKISEYYNREDFFTLLIPSN